MDSYKTSHFLQYPENTSRVSSYIASRGGRFDKTLFFGLQMFIKQYITQPFTDADIEEAKEVLTLHGLPFNRRALTIFERVLQIKRAHRMRPYT